MLTEKLRKCLERVRSSKKPTKQSELSNSEFDALVGPLHAFVLFKDAQYRFSNFLEPGFAHCFVILKCENGWINLHPTRNLFFASISDCGLDDPYIESIKKLSPDIRIVELRIKNCYRGLLSLQALTCVSVAKYLLGLKFAPFAVVTPYQLFKKLINKQHPNILSSREILSWSQSHQSERAETLKPPQPRQEQKQLV